MKIAWWIIGGCLGFVFIIILLSSLGGDDTPKINEFGENYKIDEILACVMAQDFIEDMLKSPSSAEFQPCYRAGVTYIGDYTYNIMSYVDSQNGFGAMIRTEYYVQMRYNQDESWSLLEIYIN